MWMKVEKCDQKAEIEDRFYINLTER